MDSSVYRRDQDGRVYGQDESKNNPPTTSFAPIKEQSAAKPNDAGTVYGKPRTGQIPNRQTPNKAKPQIKIPRFQLPAIKIFSKTAKVANGAAVAVTPLGRAIKISKRILALYIIFFLLLGIKTSSSLQKVEATPIAPVADTAGTNWLLVGSDSREGLTPEEEQQLHTGQDMGPQRADTIMIVHMGKGGTTLVSLPRDSYVFIPEHKNADGSTEPQRRNKLNAAYGQGGAQLLVATVEFNTGLQIDHFMEVGFRGIRDLTDGVGGVNICVPQDYDDEKSNLHVKAGCQKLDGVTALAYVRMRYADPKGDLGRIERQQQYLSAVMHKVAKATTVLNPIAMYRISNAGTDSVVLGTGDGLKDVARLGLAMKNISTGKGKISTVPISNPDANTAAGSSVIWDKEAATAFFGELAAN